MELRRLFSERGGPVAILPLHLRELRKLQEATVGPHSKLSVALKLKYDLNVTRFSMLGI